MGFEPTTPTLARLCCAHCGGQGRRRINAPRQLVLRLPMLIIIAARLLAEV